MAKQKQARSFDNKVADDYNADTIRNIDKLERELSKRDRKEAIQNARKRQAIFGCRL